MNVEQLRSDLSYLIDKYVEDPELRIELKALLEPEGLPPVKAIMSDIEAKGRTIEEVDAEVSEEEAHEAQQSADSACRVILKCQNRANAG